ncbi:putative RNA-directed DNA polymerase [Tanacetum coccineum]
MQIPNTKQTTHVRSPTSPTDHQRHTPLTPSIITNVTNQPPTPHSMNGGNEEVGGVEECFEVTLGLRSSYLKVEGLKESRMYTHLIFVIMSLHGYSDGEYDDGSDVDNVTLISKLDVSHPLHLHPNDYVALTVIYVKLKGNENYQVWSCAMLLALEGKNKTRFIDGSCRRSNTYEVLGRQWCTCYAADDFNKHKQLMKLMQFLMGLDDTYMQIRSSILSRETLPDVRSAYAIISSEESHKIATGSVFGTSQRSQTSAFNVNAPNRGNLQRFQTSTSFSRPSNNNKPNDNGNKRTVGGSTLVCKNCGFNGHSIEKCFKIIRYPADFGKRKAGSNFKGKNVSNNAVGSSSSNGFSDEQMATLISLIKENSVNGKGIHSNMAGTYMNSSTVFNKNFEKFFCSNSSLHSKLVSKGLITDSGANQHITYTDKNLVNVIDVSYLKIKVTHPNGTEAFITRIRNMPLTDYLTLYDVLVVPEYCVSLMSVHKVARDSKLVIAFDEMHCYVMNQDLRKGKILGTSKQIGGLYYFDGNQVFYSLIKTQFKKNIKVFRSDNGTEFVNQQFSGFCESNGIIHQNSCSYTPQQNGIVKRKHRHLLNVARSLLFQGGIPLNMWTECVLTATYLINKLPTSVLNEKSSYDLVYNKPPSLKHLRSFGCLAYATILNNHDKFRSRDVKFFEDIFPFKQKNTSGIDNSIQDVDHLNFFNINTLDDLPEMPNDEERRNPSPIRHSNSPSHSSRTSASSNENDEGHSQNADDFASENECFAADEDKNNNSEGNDLHDQNQENVSQDNNGVQNLRRSSRTSVFPKNFNNFIVDSKVKYGLKKYVNYSYLSKENYCFATMLNKRVEPKTYLEASQHKHWVDAMNAEMDALYRNNTWEIIDLSIGRKAIGSKWVWKIKYKSNREIERYKARLVAKGFNQREGIDFDETFSPVVKIVTVRCLINLVVQSGWSLFQMDINNAFLYGDLEETIYMTLPPGYFPANETKVCKLNKSLYGLKQAPRQWNAKLTAALLENNFVQSKSDYSLFTKSFGDVFIALLVYVDDIIITGNSLAEIEKVKQFLKTKFMIKDLGKLKYFLGIEVLDTLKGICLNQRKYCLEFIDEFGLLAGKPSNLPIHPNISLTSEPSDTDPLLDNITDQFMHNPLKSHLKTALKVIRYLKGSPGKGINVIKRSASSIDLKAYSDADWARCADTRRSITGYCIFMCGSLEE